MSKTAAERQRKWREKVKNSDRSRRYFIGRSASECVVHFPEGAKQNTIRYLQKQIDSMVEAFIENPECEMFPLEIWFLGTSEICTRWPVSPSNWEVFGTILSSTSISKVTYGLSLELKSGIHFRNRKPEEYFEGCPHWCYVLEPTQEEIAQELEKDRQDAIYAFSEEEGV